MADHVHHNTSEHGGHGGNIKTVAPAPAATVTDPVCGMTVDPATSKHRLEHAGTTYHFCSAGCRAKFTADPAQYLVPGPKTSPARPGVTYTCPMHPQIRQQGPGSCPICGMALEPLQATAEATPNHELADMTRRFWIGLALTLPVFILEMGSHIPALGMHSLVPMRASIWIQFALSTPVVLWAGWPFFQRGWASLVSRNLNMFTLIALGTGAAYLYSLVATFAPGSFPAGFRGMDGAVAVYYEAAAVITVLVLLGQVLELRAREQTGGAIRALLNLAPKTARRLRDGGDDEETRVDQVAVGDRLRVRPGDGIPVDGAVLDGKSAVDESMVTGESMPSPKEAGGKLIGGTVNGTGSLVMRADRVGSDTMLARIVAMVAEAQRSRAPIQRLADTVAGWFVPAVLAVALLAFIAWSVWGPAPSLSYALIAAVSVVIIACPCALGLATPMSIGVGVGDVHADVLPDDKHRIVAGLKAAGKVVAMAGDGVNDAPALAEADVGIAMGTGTEVAIQSAGITLVRGDLAGIARAQALSRMTMRNIRQNLVFAFAYNVIGIPLAAGVLYPLFGILLSPVVAALAMSLSSVSVIANALRLRAARL